MRLNSKHFITTATLALVVLLLASTGWQMWSVWQQELAADGIIEAAGTNSAPTQRQVPQVALSSLRLFGNTQASAPSVRQNTENLPETNLQLTLRGVLAANGDFAGSALIEDDGNNTNAYLVGDALPGNATLRSVHPTRIIIERSGKLENLYFPEINSRLGLSAVADEVQSPEPANAPPAPTDEQRRAEIRERLEQLRHSLLNGG